jgi:hypothetical protein
MVQKELGLDQLRKFKHISYSLPGLKLTRRSPVLIKQLRYLSSQCQKLRLVIGSYIVIQTKLAGLFLWVRKSINQTHLYLFSICDHREKSIWLYNNVGISL